MKRRPHLTFRNPISLLLLALLALGGVVPVLHAADGLAGPLLPNPVWVTPFALMLLCIALLPLLPHTHHWWEKNWSKLGVAVFLGTITALFYLFRPFGILHKDAFGHGHFSTPGWETLGLMLHHAIVVDYVPFIILLVSLYVISGGILVRIGAAATPATNSAIILVGALLASFIGTTGATMLLIRPLLQVNRRRKYVAHTVVFFIFLAGNIGGCLTPLGDPPLFLGYLRDVPFLWTFNLWPEWLFCIVVLILVYYAVDSHYCRREEPSALERTESTFRFSMQGAINFLWLGAVIASVALLNADKTLPGTTWIIPPLFREAALLAITGLSWLTTPKGVRQSNQFNFNAIAEVACVFIGIFVCMQVPMEILQETRPRIRVVEALGVFLEHGPAVQRARQCADLRCVFRDGRHVRPRGGPRHRGRESRRSHHSRSAAASGVSRRGVDGCEQLYRQRAEFHGEEHCRGKWRQDAELLRVFDLYCNSLDAVIRGADVGTDEVIGYYNLSAYPKKVSGPIAGSARRKRGMPCECF